MFASQTKLVNGLICLSLALAIGCSKSPDNSAAEAEKAKALKDQKEAAQVRAEAEETQKSLAAQKLEQERIASDLVDKIAQTKEAEQAAIEAAAEAAKQAEIAQQSQAEADRVKAEAAATMQEAQATHAKAAAIAAEFDQKRLAAEKAAKDAEDRLSAVKDLKQTSKTEIDSLLASLANGESTPVAFVAWGDSKEELNALKGRLIEISAKNIVFEKSAFSSGEYKSLIIANLDSVTKYDEFSNYVQEQTRLTIVALPVEKGLIRTHLVLTFSNKDVRPMMLADSKDFSISAAQVQSLKSNPKVGIVTPSFNDCTVVTESCIKSLVKQGYIAPNQSAYLFSQFGKSLANRNAYRDEKVHFGDLVNNPRQFITNISLKHELWLHSSDSRSFVRLGEFFKDDQGQAVVKEKDVLYPSPISLSQVGMESKMQLSDEMSVFTRAVYNFLGSIQPKVQNPTPAGNTHR